MSIKAHFDGRRAAGIHDRDCAAGRQPLIARIRRVRERRAARLIIGQQREQKIGRG